MLKAQYYLPTTGIGTFNADSLKLEDWPDLLTSKRMKRKTSKSLLNDEGNEKDSSMTRWHFYDMFSKMLFE